MFDDILMIVNKCLLSIYVDYTQMITINVYLHYNTNFKISL